MKRTTLYLLLGWAAFIGAMFWAFDAYSQGVKIGSLPMIPTASPNLTDTTVIVSPLCAGGNCQVSVNELLTALTKLATNQTPSSFGQVVFASNGQLQLAPVTAFGVQNSVANNWSAMQTFSSGINATGGTLTNVTVNGYKPVFNVRSYGAVGNGATDDGAAFDKAFAACYAAGGGQVYVPSSGHDYYLASGRSYTGNGCGLVGDGIPNWPGTRGTKAQWTAAGSWISCNDTVKACFTFNGDGYVKGIDFWEDQPTPSSTAGVAWTPIAYPFVIVFKQVFSVVENVQFANVTNGIDYEYTQSSNIAGTYSYIDNVFMGAFKTGIRFKDVNDTMECHNIHIRDLWNIDNDNVVTYMEHNLIGMDMEYVDNLKCSGVEFYKTYQAIFFADSTATYGTGTIVHAAANLQLDQFDFNQVVQAINLETGLTKVTLSMTNTLVQTDTDTNRAASYAFNLASDNVDVSFHGLEAPAIGNSLFAIGGGTAGNLRIDGLHVGASNGGPDSGYGYFGVGSPAIVLNRGSTLDLPEGTQGITAAGGAGSKIACGPPSGGAGTNCGTVMAVTPAVTPTSP